MNLKNILLIVFIILLLYIVISYLMKDKNTLSASVVDATTMQTIDASSLDVGNSTSSTSNFTYSIWIFIEDWNYRFGEPKVVFGRMSADKGPCPTVVLGANQNNLIVSLEVFPGSDSVSDTTTTDPVIHECNISNIPLQKWVNCLISAYGRSLDVYIDGKLVRTCVLPGVSKIDSSANVYITPGGGFSGWTSYFQYWANSTDPQTAWNIYKKGYGGSMLGNLGKYTVKVSIMEGDTEDASFQI